MTQQPGLAIENYVRRCALDKPRNRIIKSIVQPTQLADLGNDPHYFRYLDGRRTVTENRRSCARVADQIGLGRPPAHQPLHDALGGRAREEERRPRRPERRPAPSEAKDRDKMLNDEEDTTILSYAAALRQALGMPPEEAGPRPRRRR